MSLRIERVDHRDPAIAESLAALRRAAYAVEAAWLGARDFPPARVSAAEVAAEDAEVHAAFDHAVLVGALSLEPLPGGARLVASLVVAPEHHRRGIGRALVAHVVARHGGEPLAVSTGAANVAAIALYRSFGFVESLRRRVGTEPIDVVELRREGRAGAPARD